MPCWSNWIRRQLIGGSGDGFLSLIYRFLVKGVFCVQGVFFFSSGMLWGLCYRKALHLGFLVRLMDIGAGLGVFFHSGSFVC